MRGTRLRRLAPGLVLLLGVAAGCRSLPGPPPLLDGGLVASSALTPAEERAAQAHAYYSLGIHHELADEYDQAYEAYRQAAALDPGNERLILRLAATLVLQRKTEEALRTVEDYLKANPAAEGALVWLATFYASTGDQERVLQLFRELTCRAPEKPLGWLQLAAATARGGDTNAAAGILETGLAKARPPTALRQELVRIWLTRLTTATDPAEQRTDRRQAIAILRQITDELPGDLDTLYALADLLVKDQQVEEAVRIYEKIERLRPADPQAMQRLARAFLAMDDKPKAIAVLEKLAAERKGPKNTHYYLAELYFQVGDATNAAVHFQAAAEALPGDPAPWVKLAALQAETNDQQAVATLNTALEKMPGDPKLLEVLALLRLGQNRYAQAAELMRQAYESATARTPDTPPSNLFFYNYAVICTHLRQTAEAADWLRRAIDQEPALLGLYLQRAMTGTRTFRRNATDVLRTLAGLPTGAEAEIHVHLASLYLAQEKAAKAVPEFEAAREIVRKDPLQADVLNSRYYFWFGVALDQSQQPDRAVDMFETCLKLDPEYADALNYLAYVWAVRNERLEEALHHILAALALDPENAAYLDTLGWVYFRMGRLEDALKFLEQADRLRPGDPEISDHLRQVREKLGP